MAQKIAKYEIVDHGVDHAQYFQGVGIYTPWDAVFLGAGENALEAYEDAVDRAASEYDVDKMPKHPKGIRKTDSVDKWLRDNGENPDERDDYDELNYYVSILVQDKGAKSARFRGGSRGKRALRIPESDMELHTWFERDRAHVQLVRKSTQRTIIEWWDDDVREAIEDGFLNPRRYRESAIEYARHLGLIE